MLVEKLFVIHRSVGATVDEKSRRELDLVLREIESIFPHQNSIFENFVSPEKRDWSAWEEKLSSQIMYKGDIEFHRIQVPTVDTVCNKYVATSLLNSGSQVLFVGETGVGKTALIENILMTMDASISSFTVNFSAQTSAHQTQAIIESNFERRTKGKYKPKNAKAKTICFVDDLNMPRKDAFGSQPPLELLRQWIDLCWYDSEKLTLNYMIDFQFVSAMGKPGER